MESEQRAQLITFFVQYWGLKGEILSADKAEQEYGIPANLVTKFLADASCREALEEQGVILGRDKEDWTSKALTAEQLVAANSMLDTVDTRSQKKKLQDLNISTGKWNTWLRDPVFSDYLRKRAESLLGDNTHEAHTALLDRVRAGDIKAITYYNEITGRYVPRSVNATSVTDVQLVLTRVLEIIDIRVKDPDIKLAIAQDFKQLIAARHMASAMVEEGPPLPQALPVGASE